jgi:hypothetical protein
MFPMIARHEGVNGSHSVSYCLVHSFRSVNRSDICNVTLQPSSECIISSSVLVPILYRMSCLRTHNRLLRHKIDQTHCYCLVTWFIIVGGAERRPCGKASATSTLRRILYKSDSTKVTKRNVQQMQMQMRSLARSLACLPACVPIPCQTQMQLTTARHHCPAV